VSQAARAAAAGVAALALVGLAAWLFMPTPTTPTSAPGPSSGTAPSGRPSTDRVVVAGPSSPSPEGSPAVPDPTAGEFVALADEPGSLEADPMGPRPINRQGIEATIEEMYGDVWECRRDQLPSAPARFEVVITIAPEVPPPDYGTEGTWGMVAGTQVVGLGGDSSAFQDCLKNALRPVLFHPPKQGAARVRWELDLSREP
jgi:hypothetical protein